MVFQIIDPFVEVEVIGLPIDCCKEQTRVVDDNGKPQHYNQLIGLIRGFMVNALNLLVGSNVKYKFIAEIPNAEIPKYP